MLYTFSVCMLVLLGVIGLMTVCYCIMLLVMKPKRKHKSVYMLPMTDTDRENAGRIAYAVERLTLFGEEKNLEIWAIKEDGRDYTALEEMFSGYSLVKFADKDDFAFIMSHILDI